MRLIDADFLKCEIDWYEPNADYIIRRYIDTAKTIDAVPVVHAHFVINSDGDCHCSNCETYIDSTSKYCNYCGAKLDEPDEKE